MTAQGGTVPRKHLLAIVATAVLVNGTTGCSKRLHVRSSVAWRGGAATVDGGVRTVADSIARWMSSNDPHPLGRFLTDSGTGNGDYGIGPAPFCWLFQKQVSGGELRAYVTDGFLSSTSHDQSTSDSLGLVYGCAN